MYILERLQKEMHSNTLNHYYIVECPYCHTKLAVEFTEFERILFEPTEKEYESYSFDYTDNPDKPKLITHKSKHMVSSDHTKDLYKVDLCCNCGHRSITLTYDEFHVLPMVNWDGTNKISLNLDEEESKAAREFMEQHKDCCEKHLDKKWFSSTGGQFEYTICPTGLGNSISIKCNACKESKDITNTENW